MSLDLLGQLNWLTVTATDAVVDPNKPKPWVWFAISGAYHVVSLLIVAVLVAVWR